MQTRNRLFDDAARLAGGAVGTLAGVRRELESLVRQQMERVFASLDLVTRDEFDAVKEMAARARAEQEDLAAQVKTLEERLARPGAAAKGRKAPRRKASQPGSAGAKRTRATKRR